MPQPCAATAAQGADSQGPQGPWHAARNARKGMARGLREAAPFLKAAVETVTQMKTKAGVYMGGIARERSSR